MTLIRVFKFPEQKRFWQSQFEGGVVGGVYEAKYCQFKGENLLKMLQATWKNNQNEKSLDKYRIE